MSVRAVRRGGRPARVVVCDLCGRQHVTLATTAASARESATVHDGWWQASDGRDVCSTHHPRLLARAATTAAVGARKS